jgi:hypothetical protein
MWVWVIIGALFLFLLGRQLHENTSATRSRPMALLGTLADGFGLICLAIGTFGLLMAIFLGFFASHGPRLVGSSLVDVLIWSVVFLILGGGLAVLSGTLRRLGGRGVQEARPIRGGH